MKRITKGEREVFPGKQYGADGWVVAEAPYDGILISFTDCLGGVFISDAELEAIGYIHTEPSVDESEVFQCGLRDCPTTRLCPKCGYCPDCCGCENLGTGWGIDEREV